MMRERINTLAFAQGRVTMAKKRRLPPRDKTGRFRKRAKARKATPRDRFGRFRKSRRKEKPPAPKRPSISKQEIELGKAGVLEIRSIRAVKKASPKIEFDKATESYLIYKVSITTSKTRKRFSAKVPR